MCRRPCSSWVHISRRMGICCPQARLCLLGRTRMCPRSCTDWRRTRRPQRRCCPLVRPCLEGRTHKRQSRPAHPKTYSPGRNTLRCRRSLWIPRGTPGTTMFHSNWLCSGSRRQRCCLQAKWSAQDRIRRRQLRPAPSKMNSLGMNTVRSRRSL